MLKAVPFVLLISYDNTFERSTGAVKLISNEVEFTTVTVSSVGGGIIGSSNTANSAHETSTASLLDPALQVPELHEASKRSSKSV